MAGPITWRNVNTGNDGGGRLLANAANAFGSSTNTLLNVLQDQQRQAQLADKQVTESNTQDYADKVVQMVGGDPTKLADPTVQANVEKLRLSYGNNIDREKARQYVPQLLAQAQQTQLNTLKFNDAQETEAQRPLEDQFYQNIRDNKFDDASKNLNDTQFRDEDKLTAALERAKGTALSQKYAANSEARAQEDQGFQRDANKRAIAADARSIQAFNDSREDRRIRNANNEEDRGYLEATRDAKVANDWLDSKKAESDAAYAAVPKPLGAPSADPVKDSNELLKGIGDGKFDSWLGTDSGNRTRATNTITGLLVKGVDYKDADGKVQHADVSKDFLQQALNVVGNNSNFTRGGLVEDVEPYLKNIIEGDPALQQKLKAAQKAKEDYQDVTAKLLKAKSQVKGQAYLGQSDILKTLTGLGQPKKEDESR